MGMAGGGDGEGCGREGGGWACGTVVQANLGRAASVQFGSATVSACFIQLVLSAWPGTWLVLILWELFGKSVSGGRGLS